MSLENELMLCEQETADCINWKDGKCPHRIPHEHTDGCSEGACIHTEIVVKCIPVEPYH